MRPVMLRIEREGNEMIRNEDGKVYISGNYEYGINPLTQIVEILEEYVKQYPDIVHTMTLSSLCEWVCKRKPLPSSRSAKDSFIVQTIEHAKRTQALTDRIIEELREEIKTSRF